MENTYILRLDYRDDLPIILLLYLTYVIVLGINVPKIGWIKTWNYNLIKNLLFIKKYKSSCLKWTYGLLSVIYRVTNRS